MLPSLSFPEITPDPAAAGRPLMRGIRHLLVHFTGVGVRYNDPTKDVAYAQEVCRYLRWEYNFLVGLGGGVFAQAGEYRAGHCLNFNSQSIGVLLMNAIGVPPTGAQLAAFHQLRRDMVAAGVLTADHVVAPHYRYRATSCPGNMLAELPGKMIVGGPNPNQGREGLVIPELRRPINEPAVPVAPPPAVPTFPPFVPESGLWSLWPFATNKPTLRIGSRGDVVRYLQGVLKVKAGQAVIIDGNFGAQTDRAVRNLQTFFGLWVDGVVGPKTWAVVDMVAGL